MQKIIYHIHNEICKHSTNKLDEIVAYALKHGYKELYFTEHPPIRVKCFYQQRRPSEEDIKNLTKRIAEVNKQYEGKLHIYFGYELEYSKPDRWYYQELAKDPYPEFLIFGNHMYGSIFDIKELPAPLVMMRTKTPEQLEEFDENNYAAMSSGMFSWVAHPEIFLNSYRKWNENSIRVCNNIIKWAIQYKLPLGFNVNFRDWETKSRWHYPCKHFWELVAKTDIPVIIEADSHDIHTIEEEWLDKARQIALSWGLEKNLKEKIDIKWLKKSKA